MMTSDIPTREQLFAEPFQPLKQATIDELRKITYERGLGSAEIGGVLLSLELAQAEVERLNGEVAAWRHATEAMNYAAEELLAGRITEAAMQEQIDAARKAND